MKQSKQQQVQVAKLKRYALIGLASLGGGALIGFTGGLAAPFIGAGIASLGLGSTVAGGAALLGTAAGVAVVGSMFGAAGAGLAGRCVVTSFTTFNLLQTLYCLLCLYLMCYKDDS